MGTVISNGGTDGSPQEESYYTPLVDVFESNRSEEKRETCQRTKIKSIGTRGGKDSPHREHSFFISPFLFSFNVRDNVKQEHQDGEKTLLYLINFFFFFFVEDATSAHACFVHHFGSSHFTSSLHMTLFFLLATG